MLLEARRKDHTARRVVGGVDTVKQQLRRGSAHHYRVLLKGREVDRTRHVVAAVIVVADDAHVVRHANALAAQNVDHSRRHKSRRRKHRADSAFRRRFAKDRAEITAASVRSVAVEHKAVLNVKSVRTHGVEIPLRTVTASHGRARPRNMRDAAVSSLDQILRCKITATVIVDRNDIGIG